MSAELRIRVKGENPPAWATGDQNGAYFSYYENEYGEQWIAKLDGQTLRISGSDIDWEDIELSIEQVMAEHQRILNQVVATKLLQSKNAQADVVKDYLQTVAFGLQDYQGKLPLLDIVFGNGEMLWLAAVLSEVVSREK